MPLRIPHVIDGVAHEGASTRTGQVHDPATGAVSGLVDLADPALVDRAVRSAAVAGRAWGRTSLTRRTAVLFAFRELVAAHRDELAALVTAEHGKVLADAAGEVSRGLEVVEFACGLGHLLKGAHSVDVSTDVDAYSVRQPLGVVAVVSPFNFPVMVPMWFVPLAIACGNAVVLKPSERDPSAANLLARLWREAGLPDGVLQVVHGDQESVDALLTHPQVTAVSFVGSTPVAQKVYEVGTAAGKRVQALGGAKNHMLVLPDADLDLAADAAVSAGYGSAGERCMAISVLVAVGSTADDLVDRVAERTRALRTGDGRSGCDMGPVITAAARDRIVAAVGTGVEDGARLVVDGRDPGVPGEGFFVGPTLLDHVTPAMSVYQDEIFGPVLCVVRVETYEDALALVDASPYGNGTAIFTRDGGAARRFAREVEVGMVGINVPVPVPMAYYSFGGWKASLFGDTHAHGVEGVHFFTRGKVVTQRWQDPSTSGVDLGFPQNS